MRKIVFGFSLSIALVAAGCASTQQQLHQSLLLHENRQLEDALYVAQAQVADLERENDLLRKQQANETLVPPGRTRAGLRDNDVEIIPPLDLPKVILPGESGTTEVPESLRGSHMIPMWMPRR